MKLAQPLLGIRAAQQYLSKKIRFQINMEESEEKQNFLETSQNLQLSKTDPSHHRPNWMVLGKVGFLITTNIFIPILDIITDFITTVKHFMRRDYFWGSFSAFFVILPSILALIFSNFQLDSFIHHLPILQQIRHWKIVRNIMDTEEKKAISKQRSYEETTTFWKSRYDNDILQFDKELRYEKSQLQRRKIYETFGESIPQFTLQLTIIMMTSKYDWWTILSICISLFTAVLNVSNLIVQIPYFGMEGKSRILLPYQHWKLTFLKIFPLMFLVVTIRLLALSHFFAYCSNHDGILALLLSIIAHGLTFICYAFLKRKSINEKIEEFLLLGFVSSFVAPCIIIDPRWFLLPISSTSSAICLLALMLSMLTTLICNISQQAKAISMLLAFLQLYSIVISTCLYKIIQSHNSLNLLHWACENGDFKVVKSTISKKKKLLWKRDEHLNHAFSIACTFGHTEIVNYFLKSDLPNSYFNQQNVYGYTPLILACQHGHVDVVKSLLNNDFIDVKITDINGIPPPLWACLRRQDEVMELFKDNEGLNHDIDRFVNLVNELRSKNETNDNPATKFIIWNNPENGIEIKEIDARR